MSTATVSPPAAPSASPPDAGPGRSARWVRPALAVLLLGTAALYLWNLSANGYANDYYAAAVQAGTHPVQAWRGCSARSTPATRSPSTSRPPHCGS